jgi:hypothetical protein
MIDQDWVASLAPLLVVMEPVQMTLVHRDCPRHLDVGDFLPKRTDGDAKGRLFLFIDKLWARGRTLEIYGLMPISEDLI